MEIKIDTARDSKEDIRKAIRMLQSIVEDMPMTSEYGASENTSESVPDASPGMFSMFGSDTTPSEDSEEKKDDVPSIEFY